MIFLNFYSLFPQFPGTAVCPYIPSILFCWFIFILFLRFFVVVVVAFFVVAIFIVLNFQSLKFLISKYFQNFYFLRFMFFCFLFFVFTKHTNKQTKSTIIFIKATTFENTGNLITLFRCHLENCKPLVQHNTLETVL